MSMNKTWAISSLISLLTSADISVRCENDMTLTQLPIVESKPRKHSLFRSPRNSTSTPAQLGRCGGRILLELRACRAVVLRAGGLNVGCFRPK
jgi:hypothetical protein